jgi:hypothetical protein
LFDRGFELKTLARQSDSRKDLYLLGGQHVLDLVLGQEWLADDSVEQVRFFFYR